ncbi:uncharacterized protein LOC107626507 isoform X2 [Arachis ipaensis]|uniref:uncharacterized protein LOC107626507 isoform X2 n=1 Tax=Arachis ipaensis TaxID=130454 RepID=UPI000A2B6855|nr:uncharacterized protein LOC107626507 isoform X2 [Arachis ipaensis]
MRRPFSFFLYLPDHLRIGIMAFSRVIIALVFALVLLHPSSASSDFLSPLLSPIFDDVCKDVKCGKGTCKPSKNSSFFFECECDPGWNKLFASNDDGAFNFLPCIVPNCTVNHSCSKAPSPAPQKARQTNESIFDACNWVDCGGGSCNKTSTFSYTCECDTGYDNLLNSTAFPCYKQLKNSSSSEPPALNDNSKSEGSSIVQGSFIWVVMLIMLMAEIQLQLR